MPPKRKASPGGGNKKKKGGNKKKGAKMPTKPKVVLPRPRPGAAQRPPVPPVGQQIPFPVGSIVVVWEETYSSASDGFVTAVRGEERLVKFCGYDGSVRYHPTGNIWANEGEMKAWKGDACMNPLTAAGKRGRDNAVIRAQMKDQQNRQVEEQPPVQPLAEEEPPVEPEPVDPIAERQADVAEDDAFAARDVPVPVETEDELSTRRTTNIRAGVIIANGLGLLMQEYATSAATQINRDPRGEVSSVFSLVTRDVKAEGPEFFSIVHVAADSPGQEALRSPQTPTPIKNKRGKLLRYDIDQMSESQKSIVAAIAESHRHVWVFEALGADWDFVVKEEMVNQYEGDTARTHLNGVFFKMLSYRPTRVMSCGGNRVLRVVMTFTRSVKMSFFIGILNGKHLYTRSAQAGLKKFLTKEDVRILDHTSGYVGEWMAQGLTVTTTACFAFGEFANIQDRLVVLPPSPTNPKHNKVAQAVVELYSGNHGSRDSYDTWCMMFGPDLLLNAGLNRLKTTFFIPPPKLYNPSDFYPEWRVFPQDWRQELKNHVVFLCGDTSIGKTAWVTAMNPTWLVINHFEQLTALRPDKAPGRLLFDPNRNPHRRQQQPRSLKIPSPLPISPPRRKRRRRKSIGPDVRRDLFGVERPVPFTPVSDADIELALEERRQVVEEQQRNKEEADRQERRVNRQLRIEAQGRSDIGPDTATAKQILGKDSLEGNPQQLVLDHLVTTSKNGSHRVQMATLAMQEAATTTSEFQLGLISEDLPTAQRHDFHREREIISGPIRDHDNSITSANAFRLQEEECVAAVRRSTRRDRLNSE